MKKIKNDIHKRVLVVIVLLSLMGLVIVSICISKHNKQVFKDAIIKNTEYIESFNINLSEDYRNIVGEEKKYIGFINIPKEEINGYAEYVFLDKSDVKRIVLPIIFLLGISILVISLGIQKFRKEKIEKFNVLISRDSLTELMNYGKFVIEAKEYLDNRKQNNCIMVCFDIDKFKLVNDVYGYKTGDEILKCIAKNLRMYFGNRAVYCRVTGDVFGIIMEVYDKEEKIPYIVKVIKEKIGNIIMTDLNISIDLSIGIYDIQEECNINKIVDSADMARLKSKESRYQNYVIFDDKLSEEKKEAIKLEQDLFYSIKNNELTLYYQPKFNINTGEIVGSEALIRWMHPTIGIVSPMLFIPIAEKTRFINNIGQWVFDEVCSKLEKWIEEGVEVVPIAINLSRVELYQQDLIENLEFGLKKYKIDPKLIEIEITETTALNDMEFINKKIKGIKALGIKVAMDDFGTGNSNLSNLKDAPIDILKLDRSLLLDIENNEKTEVMVKSILSLSKDLNLSTICEGVENMNQVEVLKSMGCEIVQGFVFSKPLRVEEYEQILKVNKALN